LQTNLRKPRNGAREFAAHMSANRVLIARNGRPQTEAALAWSAQTPPERAVIVVDKERCIVRDPNRDTSAVVDRWGNRDFPRKTTVTVSHRCCGVALYVVKKGLCPANR
jgi:hypothetical protein